MGGPKPQTRRGTKRTADARSRSPTTNALAVACHGLQADDLLHVINSVGSKEACAKHAEDRGCRRGAECERPHTGDPGSALAKAAAAVSIFRKAKPGAVLGAAELLRIMNVADPVANTGWYHPALQLEPGGGPPVACALRPSIFDPEAPAATEFKVVIAFYTWALAAKGFFFVPVSTGSDTDGSSKKRVGDAQRRRLDHNAPA
jgi:hypothetical protein